MAWPCAYPVFLSFHPIFPHMRHFLAAWGLLLLPAMAQACDVCGIFLSVQPHDRTSSVSTLWRFRHLEGRLSTPALVQGAPKH